MSRPWRFIAKQEKLHFEFGNIVALISAQRQELAQSPRNRLNFMPKAD